MKKIIFIFCFLGGECFSQAGEWVWIKGDGVPNQPGNYGVQGVPSPTNNPPSLYEPCEWTDLNGNFWLFGGISNSSSRYGDLWKYDITSNEWTWMKGNGIANDTGNYGIKGVPSPANNPPSRKWAMASWVDNSGNFWMFGGYSTKGLSDLWRYNPATNEWTWMKGPKLLAQPGVYGIQGVPDPTNHPGNRWECEAAWTDVSGDLWIFGGSSSGYIYNDMWRYNINANQWTWMKGSQPPQPGVPVYGILGVEDSLNTPGPRLSYCHWRDNSGKLWFFGGMQYFMGAPVKNDLWAFNILSNNWTWMGGDSSAQSSGVYGTKCLINSANIPGGRFENRTAWTDPSGNFWTFGGSTGANGFPVRNDLWMYCVSTHQWVWVKGDSILNPPGHQGTLGVSDSANVPNGRMGAVGWTDNNYHLYFFGGGLYPFPSMYNDLWKYTIDTTCGVCPAPNSVRENNFINELLVFPNPTSSSLTISFLSPEKQTIELCIYNTLDKQVYFLKEEIAGGKFEKEINVEKLSAGVYFLQMKTKDELLSRKAVVKR